MSVINVENLKIRLPKINLSLYIVYVFVIIPLLAPYYFLEHETLGIFIDYWMYLTIIFLFIFIFLNHKAISSNIIVIVGMYLLLLLTTIAHNGETISVVKHAVKVIFLCCVVEIVIGDENKRVPFLYAVRDITVLLFGVNLITCIIWKNGIPSITQNSLYPYYLFGNVNATIRCVLPGMLCSSLINLKNKRKYDIYSLLFFLGFIYIYLTVYPTTTTMIAILLITVWLLLEPIFLKRSTQIYFIFVCVIVSFELMIVVFTNTNLLNFIGALFNKTSDFSGRLFLWQRAMASIRQHILFGIGKQSFSDIRLSIGNMSGSHNYFLDIMYQIGFIGMIFFVFLVMHPIIQMKKQKELINLYSVYILIGFCMSLLTMFLSEPFFEYECYSIPVFYAFLILICKK